MEAGERAAAGAPPQEISFLRDPDAALIEEDAERNAEQAERNSQMRDLLRQRRHRKEQQPQEQAEQLEAFMAVAEESSGAARPAAEESQPPWFVPRPHLENAVLRLHEELLDFAQFMKHTNDEVHARRQWVRTIASACRTMWPQCQIRVFGSFFTGLSLPNGDVDVAILDVPCKPPTAMKMLADHMLEKGEISWLEIIESAKVPVVKLRSQACGLRADVVFNVTDGIETSKFIRERLKEFPQMRPMLVFLKYFLLQRGLHETYGGGMGSYLLTNVALHFFQRHPSSRNSAQYAATSLGHLLYDFLKYYSTEFRYDQYGISVLDGGCTFSKSERNFGGKGGKKGSNVQLCLESPLNPSVDLGSPCFRMPVLRNLFHHGFHCLCHLFVSRAPAEASLLCPLLLDPLHPVITTRHQLLAEQPVALPGLPRAGSGAEVAAAAADTEPAAKRQKRSVSEGTDGEEDEEGPAG
uniref:Polymerase nucleotidyl transferase domain-containing protein n=1 Tax=Alexandrium monilatum TaxID=311494 RepID=A0A7S4RVS5_9DINO|mmetsp:Transcript_105352/g.329985  ORF Transcript_105352/g.329985 Transcript_105352/m.329985 type:complete len:467 (+) Transcript_105352:48-1448(+)